MPFKFDSTTFFLTYAQCDLLADVLIEHLKSISPLDWVRVCTEQHQDGQPHLHAVGRFQGRFQTRNERAFDCNSFHPNIQPVRSIKRALEYVSKDGNFVDFGSVPQGAKRGWTDIVEAAKGDELEWLRIVHEERMGPHVAKRLRELSTSKSVDLDEYDGRIIAPALLQLPESFQSICICGAPGIGKTGWAMLRMPRPCLLVKHIDTLREFRADYHKSIFFDDMDFKHLPRATQLQIADFENACQIHVRYGRAIIPARVPRAFACNPGNEPFIIDDAIQNRRVITYYF